MPAALSELSALRERGGDIAFLGEAELRELAASGGEIRAAAGELVLRAGEPADEVLVLLEGRLEILAPGERDDRPGVAQIEPGGFVGEVALVIGGPRTADVRALEASRLWAVPRETFDGIRERHPEAWGRFADFVLQRLRWLHLHRHLNRIFGTFAESDAEVLGELERAVLFETLPGGENLFRQGEPGDSAYILLSGSLRVVADSSEGAERVINTLAPGEMVGEMALLTDEPRSATVYAVRESDVAKIPQPAFLRLLDRRPRSLMSLTRILIDRLKRANARAPRPASPNTISLLSADPSVPIESLARELEKTMARYGRVAVLSSAGVDATLAHRGISQAAEADPARIRLDHWLHEQEAENRYVVYVGDPTWSRWSERCVRHSDHCVVLADADASAAVGETEARMAACWRQDREPRRSLVLVHPPDRVRPAGTSRWLKARDVEALYHVRTGHTADLERLGRTLAGKALGLVLGGGGARGFAHLGVLRALEELGIPVDMVGGASIGAPIAGMVAQGMSSAEATATARRGAFGSLIDYTFPVSALLAGRRITEAIARETGTWDIEDYWLPFFCVSTSLSTSRTVVHRRGSSARAIRASVAIPGVLPPVPDSGELLVDGGVLDNLPVDAMRALNPSGPVLAIDVVPLAGPVVQADYGLSVSGWKLALGKLMPWRKSVRIPSLPNTILRATLVGAGRAREEMLEAGLADFYQNIRISGVGLLDFEKIEKVADIGYANVIGPLREWASARKPV